VRPKSGEEVVKTLNIQEENSNLDKNLSEIRECHVIIEDIKDQLSGKLQLFEQISLKSSDNSEIKNSKNSCKYCKKELSSTASLITHIKNVHSNEAKIFSCKICNLKFYKKFFLKVHMKKKHPDGQAKHFECDFDGKMFQSKPILKSHMYSHLALVECQFCNKMLKFLLDKSCNVKFAQNFLSQLII